LFDVKDPTLLDYRLRDGGKVVSSTHRPQITPQKHYVYASGIHFCQGLNKSQGLERPVGLGKFKKLIHLIGSINHQLPVCSMVP
jgi:hypothetical protein